MSSGARETIESLKALYGRMQDEGLLVSLAFPWLDGGEVLVVAADRSGDRLGIRELWWLSSMPEDQRSGALEFLRGGARIESLTLTPPDLPPPQNETKPSRRIPYAK